MTDRERVELRSDDTMQDRARKIWDALGFVNDRGDMVAHLADCVAKYHAMDAAMAPTWLPIPAEAGEGVAPFDGKPWLLNNPAWPHAEIGWWLSDWGAWGDGDGGDLDPTVYAPIPPLPAPPAGEVG